ncbi:hypothetical protein T6L40_31405, partial [Pseudomonas aeruginosa]
SFRRRRNPNIHTYEGLRYLCLQAHTSNSGWTPPVAFTLWRPLR